MRARNFEDSHDGSAQNVERASSKMHPLNKLAPDMHAIKNACDSGKLKPGIVTTNQSYKLTKNSVL